MYTNLDVKYPFFFRKVLMGLELSGQSFEKYSGIKFHGKPFSVSRDVPRGPTDRQTDRQTDVTNPIVAFLSFATVPKNNYVLRIALEGPP